MDIKPSLENMVKYRKILWEKNHNVDLDQQYCASCIQEIHKHMHIEKQIWEKPYLLIEICFLIVDKNAETIPFFLNDVQRDFIQRFDERVTGKPIFVLKGRQQGFTSLITAIQLSYTIVRKNFSGFTIADCNDNVNTIFNDKARVVYDRLPEILKPKEKYNNRREFFFDKINSSWRVAMATDEIGRSKTINFCHFSEVAFYQCELSMLQKSIGEAFTADAIVVYETTANGFNEAKDLWDSGSCTNLFYEWWRTKEYAINNTSCLNELADDWIKNRVDWLRKEHNLTDNQIAWYVAKYNSYLDKASIRQEYPCTSYEAFVASGECEFGNELVVSRLEAAKNHKPIRRGYFDYIKRYNAVLDQFEISNIEFVDADNGYISIYENPVEDKNKGSKPYAIGGDTAGEGSDYFGAIVIDNLDGHQVAVLHKQKIDDDLYAEQVYCLGSMYHDAIIGIEINFSRESMKRLVELGYPNLYVTETMDSLTKRVTKDVGFRTTSISRPVIIAELKRKFRDSAGQIVVDVDTLQEMLTFVRNEKGKPEAIEGKHDDLVMTLAITHYISEQGEHTWKPNEKEQRTIEKIFPSLRKELEEADTTSQDEYISWD